MYNTYGARSNYVNYNNGYGNGYNSYGPRYSARNYNVSHSIGWSWPSYLDENGMNLTSTFFAVTGI